jgi:phosphopantothenoylcysteine decarboxylase/phosphopantothenate--cysteine ligase
MRILVGITGGIAAYKAVGVVRLLVEAGHDVKVIPTANALRFIGSATLEAISKNTVDPDLYTDVADVKHVELGQSADLIIVAPATASFIARTAAGLGDDLLSSSILASKAPVLIAPAMHTEMWENASTVANVETLRARGINVLEPAVGRLTGEDSGKGRMPEPEQIVEAALNLFVAQDLAGVKVLITAGGTREPIDSVRFIGNNSSGLMGLALYKAAKSRGADVRLVAANLQPGLAASQVDVSTTEELRSALLELVPATDVLVMTAAVSDYRIENPSSDKLKKADLGSTPTLNLIENPDLLAEFAASRSSSHRQILVGFAAETLDGPALISNARKKLESKNVDLIVANDVTGGAVFGSDVTAVELVSSEAVTSFKGTKFDAANEIFNWIVAARK